MSAIISECGRYRYRLERGEAPRLAFVMLNPSTADAELDDPTIRRCMGFAKREGFAGIVVGNVYALRSTDPRALLEAANPFGPENDRYLLQIAAEHDRIVCAWGANVIESHAKRAADALKFHGAQLVCLGTTMAGHPKHPLYVAANAPLIAWSKS